MTVSDIGAGDLLERETALGAILDALRSVEQGGGAVVLLTGPAGMGKTSLVQVGRQAARKLGFRVGSAVGSPMESGLPFGLVGQAILELGGSDVDDAVELQRLGDPSARVHRIFRWLANAAVDKPLLLALDDLHWADADSLVLLGFLARRVNGRRIMVLGSLRPEPDGAASLARELVGADQAKVLEVPALSREASAAIVQAGVSRALSEVEGERIWRACAGTPLLLKEAARTLDGGGSLPALSGENDPGALLLLERFAGIDREAFAYVQAAAILGVRFRPALAGPLAGLDRAQTEGAQARLVRARLLDDLGGGDAAFVHPLFAQALLDVQLPSELERRHHEAFRLLLDRGEDDAVVAEHARLAKLVGDPLAVEVCTRAGREAMGQGALKAAAAHLDGAVELAGDAAPGGLLLEYASALALLGRSEAVGEVCGRLLGRDDLEPGIRAGALALLARTELQAGRPAEAEQRYEQAVSAAALAGPALEVAILADAAVTCHVVSSNSWPLAMVSRALALLPADDAATRGMLESLKAYVSLLGGDPSGAGLLAAEAARSTDPDAVADGGLGWGEVVHALNVFKMLEDFVGTTQLFEREFDRAVRGGAPLLITTLAISYADTVNRLGRPQEALELVQGALDLGDLPLAPWTDLALATLMSELGRDEDAKPHIEALRSFLADVPPEYFAPVSLRLDMLDASCLLEAGEPEQASAKMLHAEWLAKVTGWREPCVVPWAGVGIEAHLAAGRMDRARALIEDLEGLTKRLACRWPRAVLELGRARLAVAEGQTETADRQFGAALEMFAGLPLPIAHAEALLAHGVHLRRSGRPREARESIKLAVELCERAGAERVARRARAELAATGGRRRRQGSEPALLTSQEQRVASLAADGMTNAQIAAALQLSPKTVGHHLQHVYAKLDIHSRRELMRRANARA